MVGTVKFETRIKELVENLPDLAVLVEPLLIVRRVLREHGNRTGPKAGGAGGLGRGRMATERCPYSKL
jgi:hypothetical protein